MIFGNLFKKQQDSKKVDQKDVPDDDVQTSVSSEYQDSDVSLARRVVKKTKIDKRNRALVGGGKKSRSNRVVHTKRSFHKKKQDSVKEPVHIYDVIERPVVTEKAANQSENGVYSFIVRDSANKHTIAAAVEVLYGVRPKKVRVAKRPSKKRRVRIPGREREHGMTTPKKKAYVFLREGDTIKLT